MKKFRLKPAKSFSRVVACLHWWGLLSVLIGSASGATLLIEHFDEIVPDYSPVGSAPGWHVLGLQGGVVRDFTTAFSGYIYDYPALSSSYGGARSGPGQWSKGFLTLIGNQVSNTLVWVETGTNFQGREISGFSYYSRNESTASSTPALGLNGRCLVRDVWRQKDLGRFWNKFVCPVRPHGVVLLKILK